MRWLSEQDEASIVAGVVRALEQSGDFRPLSEDEGDRRLWQNHDLASLVENRLAVCLDPATLSEADRERWSTRVILASEGFGTVDSRYHKAFWIVDAERRVGTLAVATSTLGGSTLRLSSLYVVCPERRRGHARRALRSAYRAVCEAGLAGIRLSTEWSWQRAVRLYLGVGMWVWGWKRSIDFVWSEDLPPWRLDISGDHARFEVLTADVWRPLIEARRLGDRLDWVERTSSEPPDESEPPHLANGTCALALAVRGFPLITSDHEWRAQLARGFSDCGGPEGLAFKIRRFEAWDRAHGWQTPAPRIPGLDYPDWDDVD